MSEHRLSEIVIERPRGGMRISSRRLKGTKQRLRQLTEEASQDGLLSPYLIKPRDKTKYLSDHLGPLRRFLRSQVGQPWDSVYSLLCQRLDGNTMAGQHVLSHVWDYVERYVEIIDGIPCRKSRWRYIKPLDYDYRDQFYVHPETGLLCAVAKARRKRLPEPPRTDRITLDDRREYHKLNEIWYLITYAELPASPTETVADVLQGPICRTIVERMQGRGLYAAHKRQCNKKEVRWIEQRLRQS
jgi:hypothetical protein